MKILRHVAVKQILTKKSKDTLIEKFRQQKKQLEKEYDQLYFQLKKLEKAKSNSSLISQYKKEMEKRKEKINITDFQLEQIQILPLGSELKETEIMGMIDVKEGDNWEEIMKEKTIVIKDGIVTEIR
ncbi:YlqD family protein [Bacillus alveayuensis]|jgi:hypothetical protein|uniref:YlqD protein n=1 Tax=Aeribacillus alveayuensis TaxID=279215 RepID=A0ABT9VL65_9BACI|nr:YlqD family protein [Bacillus alveayuensis]MDQ0161712.1 hypothetical protein [Bacillus alveayuensis]